MSRTPIEGSVETETKEDVPVKEAEVQKTGLFPMRPKTPEEIEAEEAKKNNESAVLGFPGVPVVETIRFKQEIPKIKNMVKARFDNFMVDLKNTDAQIKQMENDIKEFCKEEIAEVMGTTDEFIKVTMVRTSDHRNTDCFSVSITNNQSPVFDLLLYPNNTKVDELISQDIEPVQTEEEEVSDKEILDFFDTTVVNFDASRFNSVEEVKSGVQAYLFTNVCDAYKDKVNIGRLFKMSNEYVETKLKINPNKKEEDTAQTVEGQL
jgi:hypothetical protein